MEFDAHSMISTIQAGNHQPENNALSDDQKILINMIFTRFKAIYGNRFESTFGDENQVRLTKREWGYSLQDITEDRLALALHKCKEKHSWPPSIAEFIQLLKPAPEEFGLPDTRKAYLEACSIRHNPREANWSHPAVYFASRDTGFYLLQSGTEKEVWPRFEKYYGNYCERVFNGEQLAIPQTVAIPDNSATTTATTANELAAQYGVDASVFYYLTKTPGSEIRKRLREQALVVVTLEFSGAELPD